MQTSPEPKPGDEGSGRPGGLLARLARDISGNTLAIVGAAMIPLTAMIGSGVDMSRAYMAKHRLQSACDAAALAGRRVLQNDTLNAAVTNEAIKFFNFNFKQGLYQTDAFTPVVTKPSSGTIRVTAATKIPTAIMSIFGFKKLNLSVTCDASQNFVNTDILLVLDVTGSMADDVNGNTTYDPSQSKIQALRDAVMALYDQLAPIQTQLEANGLRLRYGIVPYSSAVNVGKLIYAVNPAYIVDSADYQSRQPIYSQNNITKSACDNYENWSWRANSWGSSLGTCTYTSMSGSQGGSWTGNFDYDQITHDTRTFKTGVSTPTPTRNPGSSTTSTWSGCIEERDTVGTINTSADLSIPSGAHDLNINEIPTSDATRWRPHWPQVIYERNGNAMTSKDSGFWACPTAAKRLTAWTRANMLTYVNSLNPDGGTYHDIGMIWGARMISSGGVFGDSPDTFASMPTARYIIFLTDGQMAPNYNSYTSYGIEYLDQRVTGTYTSQGDQLNRHLQRFRMACNAAKGLNASIWVIAFGTSLSTDLTNCASNTDQAATIANRDALIDKFTKIGQNIGALRLTQ